MDEQQIEWFCDDLRARIARGSAIELAFQSLQHRVRHQFLGHPDAMTVQLEMLQEARRRIDAELGRIEYLRRPSLRRRLDRPAWYAGPSANARTWYGMLTMLNNGRLSSDSIELLDSASTGVLSLVDSPAQERFTTLGLVVGHVQSGKTANIAATIAKASDTDFKFFLVLSGMTDALRLQTQERLKKDVCDQSPDDWFQWTTGEGDFAHPTNVGFQFDHRRQIAVIKKNAGILRRILRKLRNTPQHVLKQTPLLVIDDECDQASVSSARYLEQMTVINGLIRTIIDEVPRVAYIGYTATPFANVLIDPRRPIDAPDNLYPRDFIYPLRAPKNYFGAERLFGREALLGDADSSGDPLDMIRVLKEDELDKLRPSSRAARSTMQFVVTESLQEAIYYFLMATAARDIRGQDDHSSMLIHTSFYTAVHEKAKDAIRAWLTDFKGECDRSGKSLMERMRTLWQREQLAVTSSDFELDPIQFDALWTRMSDVVERLEVVVENSDSFSRVDYSGEQKRTYIVVGGNVLARGLTLEGLVVSFFARSSSQYDTLMQMGRWFGYRDGYEDLPRVWMEGSVRDSFRDLATVEAEVRRDIDRYDTEQVTPEQFAVRVRRIPGMLITARNKMLAAHECQVSYGGEHLQTFRFHHKDESWLRRNWQAGDLLLRKAGEHGVAGPHDRARAVFFGVPVDLIVEFLRTYSAHQTHSQLQGDRIISYITRTRDAGEEGLSSWNVAVVGSQQGKHLGQPLGTVESFGMVTRSRLFSKGLDDDVADIKALMSRRDVLVDVDGQAVADSSWAELKSRRDLLELPPLLLLYPIDKDSTPQSVRSTNARLALEADHDVLGLGLVFPGIVGGAATYVSVDLPGVEHEDVEDEDLLSVLDTDGCADV